MPTVTALQQHTPAFTLAQASALAQALFGLSATANALPSERDQNFLLTTPTHQQLVLKIANALERRDFLEAQQQAMTRLGPLGQQVQTALNGESLVEHSGHLVWLVSYLPGAPLGCARRHSPELLKDLGVHTARLTQALAGFEHPAAHREFHWDLARGLSVIEEYLPLVGERETAAQISQFAAQFQRTVTPHLPYLGQSIIHNDLNDFNVLVSDGADLYAQRQKIAGILDFGDMVHSYTLGELAVAAAYACLEKPDPLEAVAHMVSGYYTVQPLTEAELACLFSFMTLRLCVSVCVAAQQHSLNPENDYLNISQQAIRRTLPQLAKIQPRFAEAVFRHACGLPPVPANERVTAWLRKNSFAPILDFDFQTDCAVLDLSVASPLVSGDTAQNGEPQLSHRIFQHLHAEGAHVGVGRYDEARLIYTAPFFATGPEFNAERRTIHLGLDLFAEAGTPFYAPLAGTVYAVADNAVVQDYGPVIILQHRTDDGTPFHTLYGHLSRESLAGLQVGQSVKAGQKLGTFGAAAVNGGWTPHLHFQIIIDLLGLECDFPGVGRASQRAMWAALSPDPNLIVGIPAHKFPPPEPSLAETLATRRERLGRNLSLAYRRPLKIVRGWKQYLFDAYGQRYLDAYNNVPHVGHSHPRVVQAAQSQMAVLNTNTRYLHDAIHRYAEKLCATLPEPLRVCFFLNSASEANELALRLARAYTGQRNTIVLEAAYHGNTTGLIDISPYKHNGPGGTGAPEWVHIALLPDTFRGPYKADDTQAAHKYAQSVAEIIQKLKASGQGLAAYIAETCPSVGGQIFLPPGYLAEVYALVRAAGGVCIADEVQTGLGRIGTHLWAFQQHAVVPDMVVVGKPIGNGHPLAAVVTTPAIAEAFNNGMEFFSTFGGNPVSCAVGLAVLEIVQEENLMAHARAVGEQLLAGLRPLMSRYPLVGDVRGSGLFLGVELVRSRETLEPAEAEASFIANRFREHRILLGTDGPHHNVLKIRPPMPFDATNAELLVATFEKILAEDFGG